MLKFINNFIFFIISLVIIEYVSFNKDYNEILIVNNYLRYDLINNDLESFSNDKYSVEIIKMDNKIEYKIILKREAIFNFKFLKNIYYSGIIE